MDMSANMAGFRTWIKSVNHVHFYAYDFCFMFQLGQQAIKPLRCHSFCQMPVLHHAFDIQIFHSNKAWFLLYYFMDDFVFIILTDLLNALMKFLYLQLLLFYVCRGSNSLTTLYNVFRLIKVTYNPY